MVTEQAWNVKKIVEGCDPPRVFCPKGHKELAPPMGRSACPEKRRLRSFISGLSVDPEIFPLLFIMKKCYIIGRNSNFLAINWS